MNGFSDSNLPASLLHQQLLSLEYLSISIYYVTTPKSLSWAVDSPCTPTEHNTTVHRD